MESAYKKLHLTKHVCWKVFHSFCSLDYVKMLHYPTVQQSKCLTSSHSHITSNHTLPVSHYMNNQSLLDWMLWSSICKSTTARLRGPWLEPRSPVACRWSEPSGCPSQRYQWSMTDSPPASQCPCRMLLPALSAMLSADHLHIDHTVIHKHTSFI